LTRHKIFFTFHTDHGIHNRFLYFKTILSNLRCHKSIIEPY